MRSRSAAELSVDGCGDIRAAENPNGYLWFPKFLDELLYPAPAFGVEILKHHGFNGFAALRRVLRALFFTVGIRAIIRSIEIDELPDRHARINSHRLLDRDLKRPGITKA